MSGAFLFAYAAPLGALFLLTSAKAHSCLAPAPLWNFCWMVLFAAGGALGAGYDYDSSSIFLLFALVLSFNAVPLLSRDSPAMPNYRPAERQNLIDSLTCPNWLIAATALIGVAGALQLSSSLGSSLLSLNSATSILDAGKANAASIYGQDMTRNAFQDASYAVMQFGFAALGARLRFRADRSAWLLLCLNLLAAVLWTVVTTQRSYFLVEILWLASGYIAAAVVSGDERLSRRTLGWIAGSAAGLMVFVVGARAIRLGGSGAQLNSDAWSGARLWVAGYIPAFSSWHEAGGGSITFPLRLLSGVISTLGLGIDTGTQADAEEFTYIGDGQVSNASTMMRAVVLSGGTLGAFIIVISLGMLCTVLYSAARRGSPQGFALYVGATASIIWSINAWHFSNGNRVVAQVLICVAAYAATRTRLTAEGRSSVSAISRRTRSER